MFQRTTLRLSLALAVVALLPPGGHAATLSTSSSPTVLKAQSVEFSEDSNFAGNVLSGLTCRNTDLHGTIWDRADLRGALFETVDLSGASFADTSLRGAIFRNCSLAGARLGGADLSGAMLEGVSVAGADFSGAKLDGASFSAVSFSAAGGRFSDALLIALNSLRQKAGQSPLTPAFASGISGEAFSFVYNSQTPPAEGGTSFSGNPLVSALQIAGCKVELQTGLPRIGAFAALEQTLKAGGTCLLPLSLAGRGASGPSFDDPFWCVVLKLEGDPQSRSVRVLAPPFGELRFTAGELDRRWEGPWPTLQPVGAADFFGSYPLVTALPPQAWPDANQMATQALASASNIVNEGRTYGPLIPGAAGLRAAAADLKAVGSNWDLARGTPLAQWAQGPLTQYVAARRLAAAFLEEAAVQIPAPRGERIKRLSLLYASAAEMISRDLPQLEPTAEQPADAYLKAAELLSSAAEIEDAASRDLKAIVEGS